VASVKGLSTLSALNATILKNASTVNDPERSYENRVRPAGGASGSAVRFVNRSRVYRLSRPLCV
jgi:hypothetical protein